VKINKKILFLILLVSLILNSAAVFFSQSVYKNLRTKKRVHNQDTLSVEGSPFLSNFSFDEIIQFPVWSVVQDNSDEMILATRKGILIYDGQKEQLYNIGKVPYVLAKEPNTKTIFVGCSNGFGYLEKEKTGNYKYIPLNNTNENGNVFSKIEFTQDKVWFYNEEKIVCIPLKHLKRQKEITLPTAGTMKGIFKFADKMYAVDPVMGIIDITNQQVEIVPNTGQLCQTEILLSVAFNDRKSVILGTAANKFYVFDGTQLSDYHPESSDYVNESVLSGGVDIDENRFIVTTLEGGAVVIQKNNGATLYTLNFRTGLPEDEIYAAAVDNNMGIWLSHASGLTLVDFNLPVKNFSIFPGIEGSIASVFKSDTTLYVGASGGLFYLTKLKDFKEIEILEKKQIQNSTVKEETQDNLENIDNQKKNEVKTETDESSQDQKLSLKERWKKWRNRKKDSDQNSESTDNLEVKKDDKKKDEPEKKEEPKKNPQRKSNTKVKTVVVSKKTYELQSVKNIYKRIEDVKGKVKQIIDFSGGLLVETNTGLYFVLKGKVSEIISNQYINALDFDQNSNEATALVNDKIFKIRSESKIPKAEELNIEKGILESGNSIAKIENSIWVGGRNNVYRLSPDENENFQIRKYFVATQLPEKITVRQNNENILFFSSDRIFKYDAKTDSITENHEFDKYISAKSIFLFPQKNVNLILTGKKIVFISNTPRKDALLNYLKLFNRMNLFYSDSQNNIWFTNEKNQLFKIQNTGGDSTVTELKFQAHIKNLILNNTDTLKNMSDLNLDYNFGNLTVNLSAPFYLKQNSVDFGYQILEKNDTTFVQSGSSEISFSHLAPGKFTIQLKAKNILEETSPSVGLKIKIKPPYWQSWWFISLIVLSILIFGLGFVSILYRRREKIMKRKNDELEAEVQKRTSEIRQQNQEIQRINEEIVLQSDKIEKQNLEIQAGIRYASLIQKAVLPYTEEIENLFAGYFIMYEPRDIVSGDFYWLKHIGKKVFLVAADCTGHGVPGGFLSMLGISFLNEILSETNFSQHPISAGQILDKLREKVIASLHQSSESKTKDGMDIVLVIIDQETLNMEFAGAYNPLFLLRGDDVIEIKADRMPIGYYRIRKNFETQIVQLQKDDCLYMFSDGLIDQFGGPDKQRFMRTRFKQLISEVHDLSMEEQKSIIEEIFMRWQAENSRVDDILLMGVKI
jgi:serine phosphatase RsbU (regulator of sigma subunit)